jgi:hypothetical protein
MVYGNNSNIKIYYYYWWRDDIDFNNDCCCNSSSNDYVVVVVAIYASRMVSLDANKITDPFVESG